MGGLIEQGVASDQSGARSWGPAYMLGCAAAFALMSMFVKLAAKGGIPSHNLVFWRALVSLVLSYAMVRRKGVRPWGNRKGLLLLRGALGCLGMLCIFAAVARLPLAETTMIQYLHPTLTAFWGPWFLSERSDKKIWAAVALGFVGVVLVSVSASDGALSLSTLPVGVLFALAGACVSSLAYISVRALSRSEDPLVIVLYFPMVTLPLVTPIALSQWVWPEGIAWLWIAGICICTQLGQVWLTKGFASMPMNRASVLTYVQVFFAALLGWLVFDRMPTPMTWLGAVAILSGAMLAIALRKPASSSSHKSAAQSPNPRGL